MSTSMNIGNSTYKFLVTNQRRTQGKLQASMAKLSSGERLVNGESPADLGISDRWRAEIRAGQSSLGVTLNAKDLLDTTDTSVQQATEIVTRMKEITAQVIDSSKNSSDFLNLDNEFQQLKNELARISDQIKYNGLQINGKTSVATFDANRKQVCFSQSDGSDVRDLGISLRSGNSAVNGVHYAFENATGTHIGDFMLANDGKDMIYVAQQDVASDNIVERGTLMRLNMQTNTVSKVNLTSAAGTTDAIQPRIMMDEDEHVWVSQPNAGGTGFTLAQVDTETMTLNEENSKIGWGGGVEMAASCSGFAVNQGRVFFVKENAGKMDLVAQSLSNSDKQQIMVSDVTDAKFGFTVGNKYAFSPDGQFFAFADTSTPTDPKINIIHLATNELKKLPAGTQASSVTALDFDGNNNLYWTSTDDTTKDNSINRVNLSFEKSSLTVHQPEKIRTGTKGSFGVSDNTTANSTGFGLSTRGHSPATHYNFQVGPNKGMELEISSADLRLINLGLSADSVIDQDKARITMEHIETALQEISRQRANIGAQVSRLNFTYAVNEQYVNNIAAAESRIRSTDIATEAARLAELQVRQQVGISILREHNQMQQGVLRLLQ